MVAGTKRPAFPSGSCRVFVRGFDFGTTHEQVENHMSSVGNVEDLVLVTNGSAEVTYSSVDEATAAVDQLNRSTIEGNSRFIDVLAKSDEGGPPTKRFNAGGQFGAPASASGSCRVLVRGFDFGTSGEQVRSHMSSVGNIEDAKFIDRGSAEVTYTSVYEAARAVQQLNRTTIPGNSRFIDVHAVGDDSGATNHFNAGGKSMSKGDSGGQFARSASASGGCRVLVRGFDFGTSREAVENHMSSAGNIEDVKFLDRGSAEVTYNSMQEAAAAVQQLQSTTIDGNSRFIDVYPIDDESGVANHFNAGGKSKGKGNSGSQFGLSASAPGSCRVLVRGFDFGTTEEQLAYHMSNAGNIELVNFVDKGSAEVTYGSANEAAAAVQQLQGTVINGNVRFIDVLSIGDESGATNHFNAGGQFGVSARGSGSCRVLVRGFDFGTSRELVEDHMSSAGNIEDVKFIDRGSAEVTYGSANEAAAAVQQLQGTTIPGNARFIDVHDESGAAKFSAGGKSKGKGNSGGQFGPSASASGSCRVLVRGFDFGTTEEQLGYHMSSVGNIELVNFVDKGSAEVTYSSGYEAAAAVQQLQRTVIQGNSRFIDVIPKDDEGGVKGGGKSMCKGGGGVGVQWGFMQPTFHPTFQPASAYFPSYMPTYFPPTTAYLPTNGAFQPAFVGKGGGGKTPGGGGKRPQVGKGGDDEGKGSDPAGSGRVFVRGFDFGTSAEEFIGHMSAAGVIHKVHWVNDGSAAVVYKKEASAIKAVTVLNRTIIDGNSRYIDVILKTSE